MSSPLRVVLPVASALLALILVLAIVLGHSSGGSPKDSGVSGTAQSSGGFDGALLPNGVRAPDFTLADQRGKAISLSSYRGRVVMLVFLSSHCRTCVLAAQQVRGALDELRSRPGIETMFVSTDPRADTPASVSRFLGETSLSGRVEYLTGGLTRLRAVWRAYDISPARAGSAASEAGITVLLIGRDGEQRVEFGLEQLTPEGIAHDIRKLQKD